MSRRVTREIIRVRSDERTGRNGSHRRAIEATTLGSERNTLGAMSIWHRQARYFRGPLRLLHALSVWPELGPIPTDEIMPRDGDATTHKSLLIIPTARTVRTCFANLLCQFVCQLDRVKKRDEPGWAQRIALGVDIDSGRLPSSTGFPTARLFRG
jgi:hypothetical protein